MPRYFAAMIEAADIKRMSLSERLEVMELLWRSMAREPEQLASPAWHGEVVAKRLAKIEAGEGKFLTLRELKQRLAKRQK